MSECVPNIEIGYNLVRAVDIIEERGIFFTWDII